MVSLEQQNVSWLLYCARCHLNSQMSADCCVENKTVQGLVVLWHDDDMSISMPFLLMCHLYAIYLYGYGLIGVVKTLDTPHASLDWHPTCFTWFIPQNRRQFISTKSNGPRKDSVTSRVWVVTRRQSITSQDSKWISLKPSTFSHRTCYTSCTQSIGEQPLETTPASLHAHICTHRHHQASTQGLLNTCASLCVGSAMLSSRIMHALRLRR